MSVLIPNCPLMPFLCNVLDVTFFALLQPFCTHSLLDSTPLVNQFLPKLITTHDPDTVHLHFHSRLKLQTLHSLTPSRLVKRTLLHRLCPSLRLPLNFQPSLL
ncbi:hypothetical protein BCIN_08g01270 [Botrytis cinerea B05.10]|uniref:Uncharacterized protein n=1 Tax=Botryotinia fuckeliana (strain B05.10) TaxID=332648 RepID=A0A384JPU9_BOTFB|nr:hypothetical protein BCIN_08g01270 [Botrytis cinerea B05.10]ATZ52384.1 hypothetical protein BCIN_08g01270 [Botrytis cinerea B05.10]